MLLINSIAIFFHETVGFIFHIICKVMHDESCLGKAWLTEMLLFQVLLVQLLNP